MRYDLVQVPHQDTIEYCQPLLKADQSGRAVLGMHSWLCLLLSHHRPTSPADCGQDKEIESRAKVQQKDCSASNNNNNNSKLLFKIYIMEYNNFYMTYIAQIYL
jgi:hypothetical protein